MGLLKITALYKDTRMFSQQKPRGVLGSFTLGMAFAAGWTPCIGPILGGIIGMAAATSTGWRNGLVLSGFYAMGLAVPFLIAGLCINQFLGFYGKFRRHLHKVEVASGVLLIAIGLLVASGYVTRLASQSGLASILPDMEKMFAARLKPAPSGPASQASAATTAESDKSQFPPAPDVELRTSDGKPFRLSGLRGRVVLLNFWATWCLPCRAEIPAFNQMQREHAQRGLEVVGILSGDTPAAFKEFQKEMKQDYTILFDEANTGAKFGNGPGLPVTIIIDRQGRIRKKMIGGNEREAFEDVVKPLLDEAPDTAQNRD
jgi:peroxiredoxin